MKSDQNDSEFTRKNAGMRGALRALIGVLFAACFFLLVPVFGQEDALNPQEEAGSVVRVGWYESSFNTMDENGRRSGYAYEYQRKIAAYTGWTYEYVYGSWSELLQLLQAGELDLLSDVSYTPERESSMLFSSMPMGTEEYYLFTGPDNREISTSDYSTLNGKRIGVNKGSIQKGFFEEWAYKYDVRAELLEVECSEEESLKMLQTGELDGYVTVDSFTDPDQAMPICKIGSSDFYFAININRPDLLSAINTAMSRIQDENRFYNQQMFSKHFQRVGANAFITPEETDYLEEYGTIRVGYQDNYLAFCAQDKETGELTGALKDYLGYAENCISNTHIEFEPVAFATAGEAMDAMRRGEVDCMFPANLSVFDSEEAGVNLTPEIISAEIYAIVRMTDRNIFEKRDHVIVAVNEGNPNYDAYLMEHYPTWRKIYYPNIGDCLKAVSSGVADCVLVSNYRYNNISRLCEKNRLTAIATGRETEYCFAVLSGNTDLYSILARTVGLVPHSYIHTSLSYYITEDARLTLRDFLEDNLAAVLIIIAFVVLVILFLLFQNIRAARKAQKLIAATEFDDLTGLYNRSFFLQYADRMSHEHPDTAMDAIILDVEQFHSVNALNGREFGDDVIRLLSKEVTDITKENGGIASRFEADRFGIYCRQIEDYIGVYNRIQEKLDAIATNVSIRLRIGVMPWLRTLDVVQMFDNARTACSLARGHYKEHLIIFNEEIHRRELFEQRLLGDLRQALETYEFEVYYQPKFNIQTDPPTLASAEALVRWNHHDLGMIAPNDFIPLFEKNGKISELDKYVWEEAARQIVRWKEKYGVTIPVSVNLSRVDVFDQALESTLDRILRYNGLTCDALKLEVTESAYTENADQVIRVVEGLRRKGYEVEMDDFGTGYSSLNMLSAMPIDVLKMDRAFIQNIEHEEKDIQLVSLIIGIAKSLRIPVIAEGVETERQMKLLKELGCEIVQGYYFSRPLRAVEFETRFIRETRP